MEDQTSPFPILANNRSSPTSSPTRQNKQNETSFFAVHECSHFPAVVKC